MSPVKFLIILFALCIMLAGLVLIYLDLKTRKRKELGLSDDLNDKDGIPIVPRHLRKFSQEDEEINGLNESVNGVSKNALDAETEAEPKTEPNPKPSVVHDDVTDESETALNQIKDSGTEQSNAIKYSTLTNSIAATESAKIKSELEPDSDQKEEQAEEEQAEEELVDTDTVEDVNNVENVTLADKIPEESKELEEKLNYSASQVPPSVKISNKNTGLFYNYDNKNESHDVDALINESKVNENNVIESDSFFDSTEEAEDSGMNTVADSTHVIEKPSTDNLENESQTEPSRVHTSAFQQGFDLSRFTDSSHVLDENIEEVDKQDQNSPLTHARDNLNISILPINEFSHISGEKILQMVDDFGFKYGAMNMFHRYQDKDGTGVLWFSMMALTKDGIQPFDINSLATSMDIKGLVMFLPLPHPKVLQGFDSMMSIAGLIAREINGFIVDEDGNEITTDYKKRLRALLQSSLEDS